MTDLSTIYTLNRTSQKKAKKKREKNSEKFEKSSVDVDIDFVTTSDSIKKDHKIKKCKEVENSDLDRISFEDSLKSDEFTSKEHKKNLNIYDKESKLIKLELYQIPQAGDCKKKKKYKKIENSYEDMNLNVECLTNTENTSKTHKKKKKKSPEQQHAHHFKINNEVNPCIKSNLDCTQKIDHKRKKKNERLEKSCSDIKVQSLADTESIGTIRKKNKSKEVKNLDFDRTLQENSLISKEFEPKLKNNSDEVSLCMKSEFGSVHETRNHKRKKRKREKSENLETDIKCLAEDISRIPRKKSEEEYVVQKTQDDNLESEVVSSKVPKKKRKSIYDDILFTSSGLDCATIPENVDSKRKIKFLKLKSSGIDFDAENITTTENVSEIHKQKKSKEVEYFDRSLDDGIQSKVVYSKKHKQKRKTDCEELIQECPGEPRLDPPFLQNVVHERKKKCGQLEKSHSDTKVESLADTDNTGNIHKKKKKFKLENVEFDGILQEDSSISEIVSQENKPILKMYSTEVGLSGEPNLDSSHGTINRKNKKKTKISENSFIGIDVNYLTDTETTEKKKRSSPHKASQHQDLNSGEETLACNPTEKVINKEDSNPGSQSGQIGSTVPVGIKGNKKFKEMPESLIHSKDCCSASSDNIPKNKKYKDIVNSKIACGGSSKLKIGTCVEDISSKMKLGLTASNSSKDLIKREEDPVYLEPKSEIKISNPEPLVSDSVKNLQLFSDLTSKRDKNLQRNLNIGVLNCHDEPVNFEIPLLHQNESVKNLTKEEKECFESKGVKIKQGRWTKFEDNILKRNLLEFCSQYKVNDPFQLLGIGSEDKSKFWKFLKAKHFNVRLGKDLNDRTLHSIYKRARTLLSISQDGKMLKNNCEEIMKYQKMYGNNWTHIGKLVDESSSWVRNTFLWNQKPVNKGKWTSEEEKLLKEAIETFVILPSLSGMKKIPWEKVAELVPTRNAVQCRLHWGEYMAWEPNAKRKVWNKDNDKKLIDELKSRGVNEGREIDWEDLHKLFKDCAPSYMFLQKRWRKLKEKLS